MSTAKINQEMSKELSAILLSNLDKNFFFNKIVLHLGKMITADQILAYEFNDMGEAILVSENGISSDREIKILKGEGVQAYVSKAKRAYFSNNVERDPVFKREALLGVKAEMCLPIVSEGIVIGTINLQKFVASSEFTREELTMGIALLNELKLPIQNMKIYLEARNLNNALLKTIEQKERELKESRQGLRMIETRAIEVKDIAARSLVMKDLLQMTEKIADKEISALIIGEIGVGKELFAKKIHLGSVRKERNFLTVDCSTMNEALLDIELFGDDSKAGVLESANHGTVYIKRIDLMTMNIQNKLIQFINSKIGIKHQSKSTFKSNVKILSSAIKDLTDLVNDKKFRNDLYFSISGVILKVPSLRDRKEDIEILAMQLLNEGRSKDKHKSFSPTAMKTLIENKWSGNVRELQNAVERAYILSEGQIIDKLHLDNNLSIKEEIQEEIQVLESKKEQVFEQITLEELEKKHIMMTLEILSGNKTRAARSLGITVKTLYNKLHSYGIHFDKEVQ